MKLFASVKEIKVSLNFGCDVIAVGRLALRKQQIYFEYDGNFIEKGLEISPFHLPLKPGVSSFDTYLFEGLPGVFNDSLPDGWGRLLFDRFARSQGVQPSELTPLDRLAHIGHNGLGALIFEPDHGISEKSDIIDLDNLSQQSQDVLSGSSGYILEELIALNGSSAGARPKALIGVSQNKDQIIHGSGHLPPDFEPWIVKFANSHDGADAGAIEYVYALMAKEAGIEMPDVHLFPAKNNAGYFAIKRFDRQGNKRYHMHTACGLLHSDFRTPSLDYEDLLSLTSMLTRDVREVEKMFRLAVFNVLAYNRDDHSKNFSFLMDEHGYWTLSPAYDLTFSSGPRGEQSTMVMGEGKSLGIGHLQKLAQTTGISKKISQNIIEQTISSLSQWKSLAINHGVSKQSIKNISDKIHSAVN